MIVDGMEIPDTLGEWRVAEPIGAGAQATAVLVTSAGRSDEYVAKVLRPWGPESKAPNEEAHRGRFIREIGILRALNAAGCPSLVYVVDANDNEADVFKHG